ncbi:DUF4270 domain-containing protein [Flavobacterium sp. IMCC34852]|uniref:DUF4270 domain-containing protein n=1 Tax=Flavobacterium rivulicola TaxID=2732161 RepID=A0A7Y3R7C1_9FLAO|nr:DUF4270 domain-containing protein [Flavobacterium sp. IMCC34852]NNT70870.1 DUF4270 domain-containing protein [Flavobacterium sp. IMCC34852]
MFKKAYVQKILFGLIALSLFAACDKDFNELGTDIVGDDHFGFERYTGATIKAYNQKLGPISSNNLPINPLGFYTNPAFGTTQANFVTQVELDSENPTFNNVDPDDYDVNPTVIDSVILDIPYFSTLKSTDENDHKTYELDSIYGDVTSKFKLSIYQSNYFLRDLDPNQSFAATQLFYNDKDAEIDGYKIPVLLNDAPLVDNNEDGHENTQFYFDKREHRTTALNDDGEEVETRFAPSMRLHLSKAVFTNLLLNAPSGQLVNNSVFKNYFRGLYFKVENGNPGHMAMINFLGGKITVYYNEDKETTTNGVTTYEREFKTLKMSMTGNTVSLLNNSNENADYLSATANTTAEASKLYVKGGQGSIAVIDVFGPDADNNGIADEIEVIKANGWLINEANLTFYVDRTAMSDPKTIEPTRIFLYDLNNKSILIDHTYDFSTSSSPKYNKYVHGGILEVEDVENGRGIKYKIRITNHVRNLVSNDSTNVRLGLSVTESINNVGFSKLKTANSNTDSAPSMSVLSPLGTVLYGTNPAVPDDKRLKLEIYYTKPD